MSARTWKRPTAAQTGQLTHRVIADLLRDGFDGEARPSIDWQHVLTAVDQRMTRDGYRDRAARQSVTGAVLGYLTVLPEPPWLFVAAEHRLPGVRFDLLWRHAETGILLVDEIKTGYAGVELAATRAQAERYLGAMATVATATTVIVRAVSTKAPQTSWTLIALGTNDFHPRSHETQRGPPVR